MNGQGRVCVFTGHRVVPAGYVRALRLTLCETVRKLYDGGMRDFCCGGAMGFDRMAADAVLAMRPACPGARLCLILPCRNQEAKWPEGEKMAYQRQLHAADNVEILADGYYDGCMRRRNLALAERADVCVAYVTSPHSGSAQTLRLLKPGVPVINLADSVDTVRGETTVL